MTERFSSARKEHREERNMTERPFGARKERSDERRRREDGDERPPRKEKTEKRFKDTFSNKEVKNDKKPSKRSKSLPWYMQ